MEGNDILIAELDFWQSLDTDDKFFDTELKKWVMDNKSRILDQLDNN